MQELDIFPSLTFSPSLTESVWEQTCAHLASNNQLAVINATILAFFPTLKLVPVPNEMILSGHTFPWQESYHDLQVALLLAGFGLYKQAYGSLRSAVEQGLLSIYWNIDNDGHKRIRSWVRSSEDTPFSKKVWKRIFQHDNFIRFQELYNLQADFDELRILHDYVHTKGIVYSNALPFPEGGKLRIAGQRFSDSTFDNWLAYFIKAIRFIAICQLVRYPLGVVRFDWSSKFGIDVPGFGCLENFEVDRLEDLVTPDVFRKVRSISETDPHVQKMMGWVNSLPDMSEAESENDLFRFCTTLVRDMGLERWLDFERNSIAKAREKGIDTVAWENRVERVIKWTHGRGS